MVDALILSYTYNFLLSLQNKLYMDLYNIKLKYVNYLSESLNWASHSDVVTLVSNYNGNLFPISDTYFSHFFENYKGNTSALSYINATNFFDRMCIVGPYPLVDSIKLINKNLPFDNAFIINDAFGTFRMQEIIKWDSKQNKFYKSEVERYKYLIRTTFSTYKINWYLLREYRNSKYVDNCYTDLNYVD